MMAARDYYAELGVSRTATLEEIKSAFRKLALKHHPDRDPGGEARFKRIGEAYNVLSDPKARAAYDQERDDAPRDVFRRFFFDTLPVVDLALSLEEVAEGGRRTMTLDLPSPCGACDGSGGQDDPCPACRGSGLSTRPANGRHAFVAVGAPCATCDGTGRQACPRCGGEGAALRPRTIEIAFPRAVEDGSTIRFRDGIARIRVLPHPRFVREGLDLLSRAVIDLPTALLGGTATVPLLKGQAQMTIPPGTQPGQQFRLAGQGLRDENGGRGNLRVTIQVELPRHLTEEQKCHIRALNAA